MILGTTKHQFQLLQLEVQVQTSPVWDPPPTDSDLDLILLLRQNRWPSLIQEQELQQARFSYTVCLDWKS